MLKNIGSPKSPLVSVIIPTFNARASLWRAIESVKNQCYKNIEIIVVSDNTDDMLGDTIRSIYPELIYYHDGLNRGGSGARNIGIELASGEYVSFLDDDDIYLPSKITYLVSKTKTHPGYDAYFGSTYKCEIEANSIFYLEDQERVTACDRFRQVRSVREVPKLHTNGSIIKSSALKDVKFFSGLRKFQDTQLHIELIEKKRVVLFERKVSVWNKSQSDDRVTRMNSLSDYIKSVKSYSQLISYLKSRSIKRKTILYLQLRLLKHIIALIFKYPARKIRILR